MQVPAKGKAKQSITKESPTFPFPEGESRVVMFKLPEYQAPYELTVASLIDGWGLTKDVFVPRALIFDSEFQTTREVPEDEFLQKSNTLRATIPFFDQHKGDRYLLLYTRVGAVGERMNKVQPEKTLWGQLPPSWQTSWFVLSGPPAAAFKWKRSRGSERRH